MVLALLVLEMALWWPGSAAGAVRWVVAALAASGIVAWPPLRADRLRRTDWRRVALRTAGWLVGLAAVATLGWWLLGDDSRRTARLVAYETLSRLYEGTRDGRSVHPGALAEHDLPRLRLGLSTADVGHFAHLYYRYEKPTLAGRRYDLAYYREHNTWRKAELWLDGERYRVQLRAHGQQPDQHRDRGWISLGVKVRNHRHVFHARRFNLIVFPRVLNHGHANAALAAWFGVENQRHRLVMVRINDWDEMPYFWESRQDSQDMEVEGDPAWIRLDDDHFKSMIVGAGSEVGGDLPAGFEQRLWTALSELGFPPAVLRAISDRYLELNRQIVARQPEGLERFFDGEYLAAFEAARLLGGFDGHGLTHGNLVVYFDATTGLFYPAFHRDAFQAQLSQRQRLEQPAAAAHGLDLPFSDLLRRNDAIRLASYRTLWRRVGDRVAAERLLESMVTGWPDLRAWRQPGWLRALRPYGGRPEPPVSVEELPVYQNLMLLRDYLPQASPEVAAGVVDGRLLLTVEPRSPAALSVEAVVVACSDAPASALDVVVARSDLRGGWHRVAAGRLQRRRLTPPAPGSESAGELCTLSSPELAAVPMADGLGPDMERWSRSFALLVSGQEPLRPAGIADHDPVRLRSTLTGEMVPVGATRALGDPEKLAHRLSELATSEAAPDPLSATLAPHAGLVVERDAGGGLVVPAGDHELTADLVLPRGTDLTLQAGATLRLGPGVSMVVRGALTVAGTSESPVTVLASRSGAPFGTLAAIGDGRTRCDLRHLHVVGGSEGVVDGAWLSGALSLYRHALVRLENVRVDDSVGEDGLNVKQGRVEIASSSFSDNLIDAVDLDVVEGWVRGSRFAGRAPDDLPSDGLDLSRSRLEVLGCRFEGFDDKGLSVGENSRVVVRDATFGGSRVGMAVKDSSVVLLAALPVRSGGEPAAAFSGNDWDIVAYKKKAIWDGGEVILEGAADRPPRRRMAADPDSRIWSSAGSGVTSPTLSDLDDPGSLARLRRLPLTVPAWAEAQPSAPR
jgi:hypothetical protein